MSKSLQKATTATLTSLLAACVLFSGHSVAADTQQRQGATLKTFYGGKPPYLRRHHQRQRLERSDFAAFETVDGEAQERNRAKSPRIHNIKHYPYHRNRLLNRD